MYSRESRSISERVVRKIIAGAFVVLLLSRLAATVCAQQLDITERVLPTPNSQPLGVLVDPQGSLIIDETGGNKIAQITPGGKIIEYAIPTPNSDPSYGVTGPDGAQWFTESTANNIGRLDSSTGVITEFPVPYNGDAALWYIVSGPDGALWFTEYNAGQIGRMTTTGVVTEFPIPTDDPGPSGMGVGPDGAIWFTEEDASKIGRITTSGVITEFPIPTPNSAPLDIVAGPDGAMWFTEHATSKIGRITKSGVFTEFPIPSGGGSGIITVGPDQALWFSENDWNRIGRITTRGRITEYPIPTPRSGPGGMSPGPNGTISFAGISSGAVGTATACGLGLSASYANGKVSLNFDLGVTRPATWSAQITAGGNTKTLFSKNIPVTVPPQTFSFSFTPGASLSGTVAIVSSLTNPSGGIICSENQSLTIGN